MTTTRTVTDPLLTVVGGPLGSLAVGASDSTTFTGSYAITQTDIDGGSVTNVAAASGTAPGVDPTAGATDTVALAQAAALTLAKTGTLTDDVLPAGVSAGDTISYVFTVTNTGNVTVTGVTVTDPLLTVVGGPLGSLAVGASDSTTFTGSYAITQTDIDGGSVTNVAAASGTAPGVDPTAGATDTVALAQAAALTLAKTGTLTDDVLPAGVSAGDTISYVFTVTNTGNVTVTGVTVTDPLLTVVGEPLGSLAVGASDSTTFTGSYAITQTDIDGGSVTNVAAASGTAPGVDPTAGATDTVALAQAAALTLAKTGTFQDEDEDTLADVGETISYVFVVTNTGNVTLTNVTVTDSLLGDVGGPLASLAPGVSDSTTFTGTYAITQTDLGISTPPIGKVSASDYVLFAQARAGTAAETISNGSNDAQASFAGSGNSLFGRIRSNADLDFSGSNNYFHYNGNGSPALGNEKVTFRFEGEEGANFYETELSDPNPQASGLTEGTWLPVQSEEPVGPVAPVPVGDPYQQWPGNLHTVVTDPSSLTDTSDYLDMDTDYLNSFTNAMGEAGICDFGSLTGGSDDIDIDAGDPVNFPDGTYCTNGGKITLSAPGVGPTRLYTLLANDGVIVISGQDSNIEPFALGILAFSDIDSGSEQWAIQFSGSGFTLENQAVVFASKAGVKFEGSGGSTCVQAVGQEVSFSTSGGSYGPQDPACIPVERILTNTATVTASGPEGSVTDTATDEVPFFPATVFQLRVAGGAIDGGMTAAELTPAMLQAAVANSINYWRAAGMAEGRLSAVRQMDVRIADLPGPFLGFAYPGNSIVIDRNAAGHGWSVGSGSDGGVDVHDAVAHEVGHLLGLDHDDRGVMRAVLAVGERARHGP